MTRQMSSFRLGTSLFGIDVLVVREINRSLDLTEVSPAPPFVRGLVNLRGQIVTIVDPSIRLGMPRREISAESACIVLKSRGETDRMSSEGLVVEAMPKDTVGLLVDGIGDMVPVESPAIERAPANVGGVEAEFVTGIVTLQQEILILLDLKKVLAIGPDGSWDTETSKGETK